MAWQDFMQYAAPFNNEEEARLRYQGAQFLAGVVPDPDPDEPENVGVSEFVNLISFYLSFLRQQKGLAVSVLEPL